MITIKKVAKTTPISGKIIDSFNVVDKVHNAPSLNAVESKIKEVAYTSDDIELIYGTFERVTEDTEVNFLVNYPDGFRHGNTIILSAIANNDTRYIDISLADDDMGLMIMLHFPASINSMSYKVYLMKAK